MKKSIKQLKQLFYISHKAKPGHIAIVSTNAFITALLSVLWSIFPATLAAQLEDKNINGIIVTTGGLILLNFLILFLRAILNQKIKKGNRIIKNYMNRMIDLKILSISYVQTENPKIMDMKEQAIWTFENYGGVTYLIQHLVLALSAIISICIYFFMLSEVPILLVIIFGYSIISVFAGKVKRKKGVKYWEETSRLNRWFLYLTWQVSHNYHVGKEIRIYNGSDMVLDRMERMRKWWRKTEEDYAQSTIVCSGIIECTGLVLTIAAILWLYWKGRAVLNLSLVILCLTIMFELPSVLLNFVIHMTETFQLCDFSQHYLDFMRLTDDKEVECEVEGELDYIEVNNASFLYPEESSYAVNNVSLKICKGEKVAIVGRNGAGKSTLIKMICGLYHTENGEINYVTRDGKSITPNSFIGKNGVVFQDFKILPVSIRENILMGREENEEKMNKLIVTSRLRGIVDKLKNGKNTILSKALDSEGTELSGGENQEVAIARAKYGNTKVLMLDEPNSALDVYAEEQLYLGIATGNDTDTVIFVSHRLSACKFCDRIIVMKEGKIVEEGAHDDLLARKGEYFELFQAQAKLYED